MFRAPGPAGLPSFSTMLQDLQATPEQLARHLDLSRRQLQRYQAADAAPRVVMLAMFWETRWGRSAADCEAANWAALHFRRAEIAERQNVALRRQVAVLEHELARVDRAANSPIWARA